VTIAKERATSAQEPASEAEAAPSYTKEQFLSSGRYAAHRDVLNVLLVDEKLYTHDEVEALLSEFMKKEAR